MADSTDSPDNQKAGPQGHSKGQSENSALDSALGRHWTQERLHADVQRAVGGVLNLVRETARISEHLDPSESADRLIKRLQFLSYELNTLIAGYSDNSKRLEVLNRFFFSEKGFRCLSEDNGGQSSIFRLGRVLYDRAGATMVLELVYAYLADSIGITLDFVDLKPTCFLRWVQDGRSSYIDISRSGRVLSSDELIEVLHTRFRLTSFSASSALEAFSFDSFIADYVTTLRSKNDLSCEPEKLLFLQNTLIAYRPSDLHLFGERALLHRRLGNFKPALADLKRYFAFHDRSRAPGDLIRLYDELVEMIEKQKTSIEVLDQ